MYVQENLTTTPHKVLGVSWELPEALAEAWEPGQYAVDDVRSEDGVPFRCVQAHDSSASPDWKPGQAAALWAACHGSAPETALPWAHDLYHAGECMVWTDGRVLHAAPDTNFSPVELPGAWEEV